MATNPLLDQSNGCKDSDGIATPSSSGEPESPDLRQACSADGRWLERIAGSNVASAGKDRSMENFLLFVLSSSFCTLVASITLLLRPLVGFP
jgi:hypothetical protein